MIVIAGSLPIKSEQREAATAAAVAMQNATLEEPGCQAYQFSFATQDPNLMCIFEEWDDDESIKAHFATPHMAEFRTKLGDIVAGAGTFTKYEIASSGPMQT